MLAERYDATPTEDRQKIRAKYDNAYVAGLTGEAKPGVITYLWPRSYQILREIDECFSEAAVSPTLETLIRGYDTRLKVNQVHFSSFCFIAETTDKHC